MNNFRFYRRVNLFPGLSLNLSKSGPSVTAGVRGAHVTVGSRGVRRTIGIPGTGLYWTDSRGASTGVHSAHSDEELSPVAKGFADAIGQAVAYAIVGLVVWILWKLIF
jgi:hypothetical protein